VLLTELDRSLGVIEEHLGITEEDPGNFLRVELMVYRRIDRLALVVPRVGAVPVLDRPLAGVEPGDGAPIGQRQLPEGLNDPQWIIADGIFGACDPGRPVEVNGGVHTGIAVRVRRAG